MPSSGCKSLRTRDHLTQQLADTWQPPPSNQEPLVVKTMMEDHPGELGVSKSVECDSFSFQRSNAVDRTTGRKAG